MQNFQQTPIFSDVADWFSYPALVGNEQIEDIEIDNAFGGRSAYITLQPEHYFLFTGFAAATNYDNAGPVLASVASVATLTQPTVPNNFTVQIARGSQNNYSNQPLTQADVASSGQLSGKQNPYPVIYAPAMTLKFDFVDTTGLHLLDADDDPIPLVVQFWMLGYAIPTDKWPIFLRAYPVLAASYNR